VREARLSENAWGPWHVAVVFSPGEEPHLWARSGLAQARRARLSEKSRDQKPTLLDVSPKRGPVA